MASTNEFTERVIEPYGISYSTGPNIITFRDIETDEVFPMYADDLLKLLNGMSFSVTAKVTKAGGRRTTLRIKESE